MLDLNMPWWAFAARAAAIGLILLLMVRLSGKRTLGQLTLLNLLVIMSLANP